MPLLRILKTFEQIHKIKIGKSLKRDDSDCFFWSSRLYLQKLTHRGFDKNTLFRLNWG